MKRLILTLLLTLGVTAGAWAISYNEARERAWFLTDKMAYELNLTPEQYDRAYEINLEYLMSIRRASDCRGHYWNYRDTDLRYILFDWQYDLYRTLSYFFRPVYWRHSAWHYPVCDRYHHGHYYFHRPTVYVSYRGGHWHKRGKRDASPYRNVRIARHSGMRDNYNRHDGHTARPDRNNGLHNGHSGITARPDRNHGSSGNKGNMVRPDRNHGVSGNKGNITLSNRNHGSSGNKGNITRPDRNQSGKSQHIGKISHTDRRQGSLNRGTTRSTTRPQSTRPSTRQQSRPAGKSTRSFERSTRSL